MQNLQRKPAWSNRKTLLAQLQRLWDRGLLLQQRSAATELFPRRLSFKCPDSRALSDEFDAVRHWIAEIHKLSGFRIVHKTVRHRVIGENSLPVEAWVDTAETAIALLNKQRQAADFLRLLDLTRQRAPQLIGWINQYPLKALSLADVWPKLLDFVAWRQQHPDPGIYLRQISLPGIDSKFIERYRSDLAALLDLSLPAAQIDRNKTGTRQFERRYGFLSKPLRIRFRLLDPALALLPVTDQDIHISAADFQSLLQSPETARQLTRVFITENEINFLAFPPLRNSLVIFGSGYGFDALARADELSSREIFYWGDIDTHGFAILDQLRRKFPHTRSLLMDPKTLLDHREFWGHESSPESRVLARLTGDEQMLYQDLLEHTYQQNLRLEQERIAFDYLTATLTGLDTLPG